MVSAVMTVVVVVVSIEVEHKKTHLRLGTDLVVFFIEILARLPPSSSVVHVLSVDSFSRERNAACPPAHSDQC